jgi:hypothetical protein
LAVEFGLPADELSQGDLFAAVPAVYVKSLAHMVRLDESRYELRSTAPIQLNLEREHQANAVAVRAYAIVLSHDCEIDKNPRRASVQLAVVRPLAGVPDEHRDGFRANSRHRAFYLGAPEELDRLEHYADLRLITTIRKSALEPLARLASMNEDGRRMLREQMFRFFTRRFLPEDWITWEEEP